MCEKKAVSRNSKGRCPFVVNAKESYTKFRAIQITKMLDHRTTLTPTMISRRGN